MTTHAVRAYLDKSRQALADARFLLDAGRVDASLNRAYYAAFHAARAALLTLGETPRSHAGVRRRFDYQFVRTGRIAPSVARTLAASETLRQQADYDALTTFDATSAADLVEDVERFVEAVTLLIGT